MPRLSFAFVLLPLASCAVAPTPLTSDRLTTASGRLAAELVHRPYDPVDAATTCKVYHHVFAPDGRLLTKGEGGEFQHHRALFLGWNRTRRGDRYFDFWHCHNGERIEFRGFATDGAADAQTIDLAWVAGDGAVVLEERRALVVSDLDGETTRLDLDVTLTATGASVVLDGDPQHSGQQFRALDMFAPADAPKVLYVRPATAVPHGNDVWTGCDWIAAILPLQGGPVTVLRVEHRDNPPATWSTRDYGRFGAMHKTVVRDGAPLHLRYSYAIGTGERDATWCERTAARLGGRLPDDQASSG